MFGNKLNDYLKLPNSYLVKDIENFPSTVALAEVKIELTNSINLHSVSIVADGGVGAWTTKPIDHLWGMGIIDQIKPGKILNKGVRSDKLSIAINRKLTILIPDNGNLGNCPRLRIEFFDGNKYIGAIASCGDRVK